MLFQGSIKHTYLSRIDKRAADKSNQRIARFDHLMHIAIIPARSGSKRIPNKNIRNFHGRPMISYAISVALDSGLFEHVVVSTDDVGIAEIAKTMGAEVPFLRPAELADDLTPTVPVVAHAIEQCIIKGWSAEYVCCIYPAVPLLHPDDLASSL